MSARTGDPRKTVVPKTIMAESTNEVTLDDAGRNQISVSGVSGLAPSQVWGAGSGHCGKSSKHLRNFRVGTLNVNTLKGRVCEVVETLSRRPLLCPRDQIPGWSLPYNNWQRLKVQTVLVWKQQGYRWCWSVCGGEADREGI